MQRRPQSSVVPIVLRAGNNGGLGCDGGAVPAPPRPLKALVIPNRGEALLATFECAHCPPPPHARAAPVEWTPAFPQASACLHCLSAWRRDKLSPPHTGLARQPTDAHPVALGTPPSPWAQTRAREDWWVTHAHNCTPTHKLAHRDDFPLSLASHNHSISSPPSSPSSSILPVVERHERQP